MSIPRPSFENWIIFVKGQENLVTFYILLQKNNECNSIMIKTVLPFSYISIYNHTYLHLFTFFFQSITDENVLFAHFYWLDKKINHRISSKNNLISWMKTNVLSDIRILKIMFHLVEWYCFCSYNLFLLYAI